MVWMGPEEVMITLFELGHVLSLHRNAKTGFLNPTNSLYSKLLYSRYLE